MTTITLQKATETLKNLNASLTKSTNVADELSGTYALINDMISNLSSIKAAIKTEEKKIEVDLHGHMLNLAAVNTAVGNADAVVAPETVTMTESTVQCTAGIGAATGVNKRHQHSNTTNTLPAVYTANSVSYSEQAVFSVLALASEIIDKLKAGAFSGSIVGAGNNVTETTLS